MFIVAMFIPRSSVHLQSNGEEFIKSDLESLKFSGTLYFRGSRLAVKLGNTHCKRHGSVSLKLILILDQFHFSTVWFSCSDTC